MPDTCSDLPRTAAEFAARDRRAAQAVLDHPVSAGFPKLATSVLAHVADGDHDIDPADVRQLVLVALAIVVGAEIVAGRRAAP
jgi:hypothetical protein